MKRYIITSAQSCATVHKNFWEGLQHYAQVNEAEIIILPLIGQSAKEDWDRIRASLTPYLLYKKKKLNSNISIEQFNVRPYQIDPITGLKRFAQQGTTLVFASPKQRLRPIPHSHKKYPKFLVTTGAVTLPNYATGDDVSAERRRLGDVAKRDHVLGALIVEIENDERYHMRHIRANSKGDFVDLGVRYSGNTSKSARLDAMVLGDYHTGQTNQTVEATTFEMVNALNPRRLILHDFFDGHSISHHSDKKPIRDKLLQVYDKGLHKLDDELKTCYETLIALNKVMKGKPIYIVFSNHHVFLHRYLEEGRFAKDLPNFRTALKLLSYMAEKDYNDPVEAGIKMFGRLPKSIHFLKEDDDMKIRGYQLAAHGDKGAGGGRGSIRGKENDFGKSITGHTHRAEILRNTYVVGTMLRTDIYYTRGYPSDWTHTHALLWNTGTVQLVNIFDGSWRI